MTVGDVTCSPQEHLSLNVEAFKREINSLEFYKNLGRVSRIPYKLEYTKPAMQSENILHATQGHKQAIIY